MMSFTFPRTCMGSTTTITLYLSLGSVRCEDHFAEIHPGLNLSMESVIYQFRIIYSGLYMVYKQFRDICTMSSMLMSWNLAEGGNQNQVSILGRCHKIFKVMWGYFGIGFLFRQNKKIPIKISSYIHIFTDTKTTLHFICYHIGV